MIEDDRKRNSEGVATSSAFPYALKRSASHAKRVLADAALRFKEKHEAVARSYFDILTPLEFGSGVRVARCHNGNLTRR